MPCLTNQQGHRSHQDRPHHRWLGSSETDKQQQRHGRQGKPQARRPAADQHQHNAEQNREMKPRCRKGMGQAGHPERLSDVCGELHLGAAQHQGGQETTPPRPDNLLQSLGNIAPQVSQWRPWTLQHLDALDPQLTPNALTSQTFCRSRQQRVGRWQRTPQHPYGLDSPALQQRRRAGRQLKLGSSIDPASLDPIHLQQSRTSRGKSAHISEASDR